MVAVDESAEMLAYVRGAETVLARAQDLRLERTFDAVLLASQLVNTADDAARRDLLDACARHLAPGGKLIIQWMPADAQDRWRAGQGRDDGPIRVEVATVTEAEPGVYATTMRYTCQGREWTQSFHSRRLTDEELATELAASGLVLERFLTEGRHWLVATPG